MLEDARQLPAQMIVTFYLPRYTLMVMLPWPSNILELWMNTILSTHRRYQKSVVFAVGADPVHHTLTTDYPNQSNLPSAAPIIRTGLTRQRTST